MKNFILLISLFSAVQLSAQTSRLKDANTLYSRLSYYQAAEAFEDVLDATKDSSSVSIKLADCYDKIENNEKAVIWYNYIIQNSQLNQKQLLRSAVVRRQVGDYAGSLQQLREYEAKYGSSDVTKKMILEHDLLERYSTDKGVFMISNQDKINTYASEMGASYFKDNQYFVSSSIKTTYASEQTYGRTGSKFYNIYLADLDENGQMKNLLRMKNTVLHDGPIVYDSLNDVVYFTRNNYINGKKATDAKDVIRLKIYRGKIVNNKITDEVELAINSDQFSTGHPSISSDGKFLYFASDRPGGFGGSDIYRVGISPDGTTGLPENLGAGINTSLNEFFPSFNDKSGLMFFSSEGHTGLGGLDVFYAEIDPTSMRFNGCQNVGSPVNSQFDDFSFSLRDNTGFFASNRSSGQGDDDIYWFSMSKPFQKGLVLEGVISDVKSLEILPNALVNLFDEENKLVGTTTSDSLGRYTFLLDPTVKSNYKLSAVKPSYEGADVQLSTKNIPASQLKIEQDLALNKGVENLISDDLLAIKLIVKDRSTGEIIPNSEVRMYDNVTRKEFVRATTNDQGFILKELDKNMYDLLSFQFLIDKTGYSPVRDQYRATYEKSGLIEVVEYLDLEKDAIGKDIAANLGIKNIYFDLDKYNIRPDAKKELDKIVQIMNEYPEMIIELTSHTDCRQSEEYNDQLSENRAIASANYIKARISNPSRISGKGYGESRLVNDCGCEPTNTSSCTEAQHQLNRRTEFIIQKVGVSKSGVKTISSTSSNELDDQRTETTKHAASNDGATVTNDGNYEVKKGETLFRISEKTGVSVDRLKEINGLRTDVIRPGQTLRLL